MKLAILCIVLLSLTSSHGRELTYSEASASTSASTSGGTVKADSKSETASSAAGPVTVKIDLKLPASPASSPPSKSAEPPKPSHSPMASPPMVSTPSPEAPPPMVPTPSPEAPPPMVPTSSPMAPPPMASTPSPADGDGHSHLDVYFLVDTTKGMEAPIKLLQQDKEDFLAEIYALADEVRVGVGEYKDVKDSPVFENMLPITANQENAASAILSLSASGGGASKKGAQLYALETVATDSGIGFDDESAIKIVVWIGDQSGRDPALGSTEASATEVLQISGIQVIAIDIHELDAAGQASRIAEATEGVFKKVDLEGDESKTASVKVTNGSGMASASASGDTVKVSAEAGEKSAKVNSEDPPALQDTILDSLESLIS